MSEFSRLRVNEGYESCDDAAVGITAAKLFSRVWKR